jgi:hypothetical protein
MVRQPDPAKDRLKVPANKLFRLAAKTVLHRVHLDDYSPKGGRMVFNPSSKGNARFSPIRDGAGAAIPVIYAGTTGDCALMESVFHDVPLDTTGVMYDKTKLDHQVHTQIETTEEIVLIDLMVVGLRWFKLQNTDLIDTPAADYPATRKWGEALYEHNPGVQGLYWISRLDNRAQAMVLFERRIGKADWLKPIGAQRPLVNGLGDVAADVVALAEKISLDLG